jgi:hypothetical protein
VAAHCAVIRALPFGLELLRVSTNLPSRDRATALAASEVHDRVLSGQSFPGIVAADFNPTLFA